MAEKYTKGFYIDGEEYGIASALSATYDSDGNNIAETLASLSGSVSANPEGEAEYKLSTIKIGNTVYDNLPEAGTGVDYDDNYVIKTLNEIKFERKEQSSEEEVPYINVDFSNEYYEIPNRTSSVASVYAKITIPNNFNDYESVKVTIKTHNGDIQTLDLKTITKGAWILLTGDEQAVFCEEKTDNSIVFQIQTSIENYNIFFTHTECKYAPRLDGKKLNVQTDNTTIKVNEDNEIYADLTDIETAIGKDENDNLVIVSERIKDEAADANYNVSYSYDDDITINKVDTIIPWEEEYPELELAIDYTSSGNFVNHGYFRKTDGEYPFEYICYAVENPFKPTKISNKWHIVIMTTHYYFIYDPTKSNELQYSYNNGDTPIKIKPRVLVETSIKDKIDSVEDSIVNVEANPTEEATEDLSKIKIGDTVYNVGSSEGPSKIYDSATDTTYHGNLWETDDGSITVGSSEDGYNELEIYYSSKDSGQIQYYKINTEMITSPKTDKGMFYVLVPGSNGSAFDFEQIEVSIVTDTEGKKSVKLASKAGTDSIVKIERVYNVQPGNGGSGGGSTGSGVAPAEAPTEEGTYLVEAKLVAGEMTLTYKSVTDLDGETY